MMRFCAAADISPGMNIWTSYFGSSAAAFSRPARAIAQKSAGTFTTKAINFFSAATAWPIGAKAAPATTPPPRKTSRLVTLFNISFPPKASVGFVERGILRRCDGSVQKPRKWHECQAVKPRATSAARDGTPRTPTASTRPRFLLRQFRDVAQNLRGALR